MAKTNGKYYLLGNFTNMVANSGSGIITDTAANTILNDHKWRINGVVKASVPDGQGGFYIGGTFTRIGDSSRKYIAQIDGNGAPTSWKPVCDSIVNVLLKRNDTLFIGGAFKHFSGKNRSCFAMYSTTGDSLCTNGGIQAFTFMQTINTFILNNDTLIYGGAATNVGGVNIRKYGFRNNVNIGWTPNNTDYGIVNYLALSPDKKVIIYSAYYNGEYIKGYNNQGAAQQYFINVSMFIPYGANTGSVFGLKVLGAKAYAVGVFEFLQSDNTYARKGFFSFDPNTGSVKPDNLNLNGYASLLETRGGKLIIGGKFTSVNGIARNQFVVVDTGTLAIDNWQLDPSDALKTVSFTGSKVFAGGYFKGIHAVKRNGFAAIDSATHTVEAWNPVNTMNLSEGKRMQIRGDSLFVLGYLSNSGCYPEANTVFKIFSLSTGNEYSINEAPALHMNDFIIDNNYLYVSVNRKLRRFSLPSMVQDVGWGYDWQGGQKEHSMIHLSADSGKIYAVGDTRYTSCANTSYQYRGYFDVYSKATGQMQNSWFYEGASNQYDVISFTHSLLVNNKLYIQGSFKKLNDSVRKDFACIDINTGLLTAWKPNFSADTAFFFTSSELKMYKGRIYFGSEIQRMRDGNIFYGFGSIDTLSGGIVQPLKTGRNNFLPGGYQASVTDFILSDAELSVAGYFDTVNTQALCNFAVYHLTGNINKILCAGGNGSISAGVSGTAYQWQINTGNGFTDITDNVNFSGSQSATLQLTGIPSSWYGYELRCSVDVTASSEPYKLSFKNNWTGSVSTAWENPANWSCGSIPDSNTDVQISSGNVTLNANTVIRSLSISPAANVTVAPGVVLTILH